MFSRSFSKHPYVFGPLILLTKKMSKLTCPTSLSCFNEVTTSATIDHTFNTVKQAFFRRLYVLEVEVRFFVLYALEPLSTNSLGTTTHTDSRLPFKLIKL